ncbi:MerR family transcriptional regulator [Nocardia sp. NPDC058705]|uniref:MerR family transcriptional regulator n=1 Tax=Nocardia sp. NPDC058705 TaxID=3346609 RepID=UPI0036C425C6
MLSIGELSDRTGVPASTLRYYDDLGLVLPAARVAGQRRYTISSVTDIGLIVYFRDVGFTLAEIKHFVSGARQSRRELVDRKLKELVAQQHRIQVALDALEHGRVCPADDQMKCPRLRSIIEGHQHGFSVQESHARAH